MPPRKKATKKKTPQKKAEPVIEVIDLLSSSPLPQPTPPLSTLTEELTLDPERNAEPEYSDYDSEPPAEPLEVPLPSLADLAAQYPDRDDLYERLISFPRPVLATMLLSHIPRQTRSRGKSTKVKVKPAPTLAHCVYCHKIYDKNNNYGCKVKHWGEFEDEEFTCCGLYVYYESHKFWRPPPEEDEPWCYQGAHWDVEVCSDDEEEGIWRKEWAESGMTCKDLECEEELKKMGES